MISLSQTPWTRPSHDNQRTHAILHAVKAAGKLAAILEAEGHGGREGEPTVVDQPKYAADLVISAIRLADVCGFNLEAAVLARQQQRNSICGVKCTGIESGPCLLSAGHSGGHSSSTHNWGG